MEQNGGVLQLHASRMPHEERSHNRAFLSGCHASSSALPQPWTVLVVSGPCILRSSLLPNAAKAGKSERLVSPKASLLRTLPVNCVFSALCAVTLNAFARQDAANQFHVL